VAPVAGAITGTARASAHARSWALVGEEHAGERHHQHDRAGDDAGDEMVQNRAGRTSRMGGASGNPDAGARDFVAS
jgi:hypothetical protein